MRGKLVAAWTGAGYVTTGKVSTFGGPHDSGVKPSEGLALFGPADVLDLALFLPEQPAGTTGEARRLNPHALYIACRWDYDLTPKEWLRQIWVMVVNRRTEHRASARPVDWGPNRRTGRVADLSPGLAELLRLNTDDECGVIVPTPGLR